MATVIPLSEKEMAQLESLQARQDAAMMEMQAAAVKQRSEAMAPLIAALGTAKSINATIEALKSARGSLAIDDAMRVDRIITILTNDVLALVG